MAGLVYPLHKPRPTDSAAEKMLWEKLGKNLPDGWIAWHSLRLKTNPGWEGEGDFVLAQPGRGFLVLEVKGGRVALSDGLWMQNGHPMKKPPRDQAQSFAKNLAKALRRSGCPAPGYGIACAFPETSYTDPPTGGDLQGLVIGARDLPYLGVVLPTVFARAVREPEETDGRWIDRLHELWGETWVPHVKLRDRVEDATARCLALNEEQLEVLDCLETNHRMKVGGGAGSGKTVLARELCARRAKAGGRVLYLCFTDALAQAVGDSLSLELGDRAPTATSVRRLAHGIAGGDPDDNPEWLEVLARATRALADRPPAYDFVAVDESQDLEPADWAFIEALVGDGGVWVFGDPRQSFWEDRGVPSSFVAYEYMLRQQHRNPRWVEALAESYRGGSLERLGAGDDEVRVVVQENDLETALAAQLDWLMSKGASPSDVAVLSAAGQTRTELLRLDAVGAHALRRADDPEAGQHVVADTFLRFKGLERPFIIVVEPQLAGDARYDTRMHIAITRATAGLTVLCPAEAIAADERLAKLL